MPKQKLLNGENIISLLLPMGGLGANSAKTLEVYVSVEGGTIDIAPANIKAVVAGSGIASGYVEWDGKIVIEEKIAIFSLQESVMTMKPLSDGVGFLFYKDMESGVVDTVPLYTMGSNSMTSLGLTDYVEIMEGE